MSVTKGFSSVFFKCFHGSLSMNGEGAKHLMSGNEAIARGAIEAGVAFCASYPGTPSTEITETLMKHAEENHIYVEWSTNEKVALEAAAAASWAGIPALCPLKSLGLNVAADFLLNLNLSGSGPGGLVIVVCDDPKGHSSSNEQDSRFYSQAAYLPLIEPTTCQEAKDLMKMAYDISRRHQVPVIVRSTTRLSHSSSVVETQVHRATTKKTLAAMPERLYNVPQPHLRHIELDKKRELIQKEFEGSSVNSISGGENAETLIIATGVCHRYALEAVELVGTTSIASAKLVTTHPLPRETVVSWLRDRKRVIFVEEVDPFVENQILAFYAELSQFDIKPGPIDFFGKRNGYVPYYGEMNTDEVLGTLQSALGLQGPDNGGPKESVIERARELLAPRPLTFCAGCTHRNVYWAIQRLRNQLKGKLVVTGDIGCYSLGVFQNEAMNTMQAMGSGIGTANGLGQLGSFGFDKKVVSVAGDSTFLHACIPGLVNARHKNADLTFLILDNSTTAMTGFQEHPGSYKQESGHHLVSIQKIVEAIEPDIFKVVDATDVDQLVRTLQEVVSREGLKVLLLNSICRLELGREGIEEQPAVYVDETSCRGDSCRICVSQFGCPAIEWNASKQKAEIVQYACIRCGACIEVCPSGAIRRSE